MQNKVDQESIDMNSILEESAEYESNSLIQPKYDNN